MTEERRRESGDKQSHTEEGCIVCSRPSGGKAICSDPRCAEELAQA